MGSYSLPHLFILEWTHWYQLYIGGYTPILFCSSTLAFGALSLGSSGVFNIFPSTYFFLYILKNVALPYFLPLQNAPASSCIFPAQYHGQTFLQGPKEPWTLLLENGISKQDQGMRCAHCFQVASMSCKSTK